MPERRHEMPAIVGDDHGGARDPGDVGDVCVVNTPARGPSAAAPFSIARRSPGGKSCTAIRPNTSISSNCTVRGP
jgi:hypothetical protein